MDAHGFFFLFLCYISRKLKWKIVYYVKSTVLGGPEHDSKIKTITFNIFTNFHMICAYFRRV